MNLFNANTLNIATANVIYQLGKLNVKGSKHIVIVPDKYSLGVEREIFERLELCGASNIDVVSFTRLAVKAQSAAPKRCLSKEGAVILLRKVVDSVAKNLVHYNHVAHLDGFPKEIFAVIAAIRNCGYSADDLLNSIPSLPPSTARKTKDIALILEAYLNALENTYDDSTTRLDNFIANMDSCDWVKASNIYVVGFPSFTGKQLQIIAALTVASQSMNIAINTSNQGKNSNLYPMHTELALQDICTTLNLKPTINDAYGLIKEPFSSINKGLFAFADKSQAPNADKVLLINEEHIYNEISAVACEINRLVRRENYRFKDIAVVNCVQETSSIISTIFDRFAIPHFVDNSVPLGNTLVCKFLLSILHCAGQNFKQSAFIEVLKSPYLNISHAIVENMENFILKYGLTFTSLSSPFKIPEGVQFETVRATIAKYVALFPQKSTCFNYANNAKILLENCFVEDVSTLFDTLPNSTLVSFNNQAHERLVNLIDEASFLLHDTETSLHGFINTLSATIEACKISLIPEYIDSVFVGSPKDNRFTDIKALFVLGCSSDALPAMHKYKAIISAMDNNVLEQAGIRLYPTPMDLIKEDQYYFLELMSTPSERLYLSYPTTSFAGIQQRASSVIKEISNITGAKLTSLSKRFNPLDMVTKEELEDALVTTNNAYFEYLYNASLGATTDMNGIINIQSMYMALDDKKHKDIANNTAPASIIHTPMPELYFRKNDNGTFNTSITAIEQYYRCPYAHHLQVGLKLKERETVSLQSMDIGNIMHGIMEIYFSRTLDKLDTIPHEDLNNIMDTAIEEACNMYCQEFSLQSALNKNMLDNVKREGKATLVTLTENVLRGNYRPKYIELSFGINDSPFPPITFEIDGTKYLMRGKIDRVDICDDRITVIDYKTGSVDSSIASLYMGKKLQLYTYLNVLTAEGYKVGGVFYLPLKDTYTKTKVSYKLQGQILHDTDNLNDLCREFMQDALASGKRTTYCDIVSATAEVTKKNGAVFKANQYTATEDDFKNYSAYAYEMTESAIAKIVAGDISRSPIEDGCDYCSYKAICGEIQKTQQRKPLKSTKVKPYSGALQVDEENT